MGGQEGEKPQEDTEWGAGRMRRRGRRKRKEKRERERERERRQKEGGVLWCLRGSQGF